LFIVATRSEDEKEIGAGTKHQQIRRSGKNSNSNQPNWAGTRHGQCAHQNRYQSNYDKAEIRQSQSGERFRLQERER
jgi:hypothetical protein